MQIEAGRGELHVRVGQAFRSVDVLRIRDALAGFGPSSITIDFGATRECDDAALVYLTRLLRAVPERTVALRGLTLHQRRLLTHVGLPSPGSLEQGSASAA